MVRDGFWVYRNRTNKASDWVQTQELTGKYANSLVVPEKARRWKNCLMHLLGGFVDGDGHVRSNHNELKISSICESFLREIQIGLLNCGIVTSLTNRGASEGLINGRMVKSRADCWELGAYGVHARTLYERLPLRHKMKSERAAAARDVNSSKWDIIPYLSRHVLCEFAKKHLGGGWYLVGDKKIRVGLKYADGTKFRYGRDRLEFRISKQNLFTAGIYRKMVALNSDFLPCVQTILSRNETFLRVRKVAEAGEAATYDIQVEGAHEFVANGALVHNCSGNYHPHGEQVVYPTLYRLVQAWALRYPLLIGQGNFGNRDGDPPAAARYTESKLSHIGSLLLEDLNKDVVPYQPNYNDDPKCDEPTILPAKIPNLLLNGCTGIAVGWATNMPPHNLREVVAVIKAYIENPAIDEHDVIDLMPGPDFPTGGRLLGQQGVLDYYRGGSGSLVVEGVYESRSRKKSGHEIIITELPYIASAGTFIKEVVDLVKNDDLTGVTDMKDLSSKKDGLQIWLEVGKFGNPELIINTLLRRTCLRKTFSVNQTVLIDGKVVEHVPVIELVRTFVEHREKVLDNKFIAECKKKKLRSEVVEGYLLVADDLDKAIRLIRNADSRADAKQALLDEKIVKTDVQADAVLAMTLGSLTKLETEGLHDELGSLRKRVIWLNEVIGNPDRIRELIIEEQEELAAKYGDDRRTQIEECGNNITDEDLIKDEKVVVLLSGEGYLRRIPVAEYKIQHRGGKGVRGEKDSDDGAVQIFEASTKEHLLFFTNTGQMYPRKVYVIPQSGKSNRGIHVSNLLSLSEGETVTNMIALGSLQEGGCLVMVTRKGYIKRVKIEQFDTARKNAGITATKLEEGDEVSHVIPSTGNQDIFLITKQGKCVRYSEGIVPIVGRVTRGSRSMLLAEGDGIAQVFLLDPDEEPDIFVITSIGKGKRSGSSEYRRLGGRHVKGYSVMKPKALKEANTEIVGACTIQAGDSLLALTKSGQAIRFDSNDIRSTGRATAGVKVVSLRKGDVVTKLAKIMKEEVTEDESD